MLCLVPESKQGPHPGSDSQKGDCKSERIRAPGIDTHTKHQHTPPPGEEINKRTRRFRLCLPNKVLNGIRFSVRVGNRLHDCFLEVFLFERAKGLSVSN